MKRKVLMSRFLNWEKIVCLDGVDYQVALSFSGFKSSNRRRILLIEYGVNW